MKRGLSQNDENIAERQPQFNLRESAEEKMEST